MSGYLQRLVRNAMQPAESSIRPLVGSMFSPAEQASDSLPREEHVELSAQPGPLRPALTFEESVSTRSISPRSERQMLEKSPEAQPVPSLNSLPPADNAKLLQPFPAEQNITHIPEQHHQINGPPRLASAQPKQTFTPLMSERPAHVGPSDTSGNSVGVRHAAAPTHQQTNAARSLGREPDEIQIHIGRIEVTAVQQAPARTAIKPARKGQSLEEYLSRRDRRA
ncbi:MAG TPA: hypothetical protein VKB58_06180 [Terriglobales bacterium]|jgi:hypothetical protein|nr:hypothetical protein [Terriglobales bacterium]